MRARSPVNRRRFQRTDGPRSAGRGGCALTPRLAPLGCRLTPEPRECPSGGGAPVRCRARRDASHPGSAGGNNCIIHPCTDMVQVLNFPCDLRSYRRIDKHRRHAPAVTIPTQRTSEHSGSSALLILMAKSEIRTIYVWWAVENWCFSTRAVAKMTSPSGSKAAKSQEIMARMPYRYAVCVLAELVCAEPR
jgi:hypothetical protein